MKTKLNQLKQHSLEEIEKSNSLTEIEDVKLKYLSKKGELNQLRRSIKDIPAETRAEMGAFVNTISNEITQKLSEKLNSLQKVALEKRLLSEKIDVTLPAVGLTLGKDHPLVKTKDEMIEIFKGLGFSLAEDSNSPEVETEYYNFEALNFPKNHPARDMQDTFYTKVAPNVLLRSQTSNSQIRQMENKKPPLALISPGRVYRAETISARKNNLFHQFEGFMVDRDVNFTHLKGILDEFIKEFFGSSRKTRFRNSFFPFTEPSAEVDVECIICGGSGCRTCGGSGWLEILGCGMIDPNVLKKVNIDPEIYSGFAFGMGLERLAMLKYAINDIRLFFNNDVRFLAQF